MKKFLLLLWDNRICQRRPLLAQKKKQDSYSDFKSRSSQTIITQLLRDAESVKKDNPTQALNFVQEALGMSLSQGDVVNEARCYLLIGEINEQINEWTLALENYTKAYQLLAVRYASSTEYNRTLRGLGNTYLKLANYDQALNYYNQTLALRLSATEKAELQLDISEVYFQKGDYAQALVKVEEIKINQKVADDVLLGKIQNQKAKIYARTPKCRSG
jgi:tetratricopeptide (TPR) repeat protein